MLTRLVLLLFGLAILGGVGAGGWWLLGRKAGPVPRAERLMQAGDLRTALVELRSATRDKPNDPAPHMLLAEVQLRLSDAPAAERELARALTLGADKWAVLVELAPVLTAQGRYKDVLARIPREAPTPEITAALLLARSQAQLASGDEAAARASLAAADRALPGSAAGAVMAARLDLAKEDAAAAERHVDLALQRNPASLDALIMKERLTIVRGDAAAALALVDRAIAAAPWSSVARLDRVSLLLSAGQDVKARADVETVLAMQPRDTAALLAQGVLMMREGRYADAAVELQKLTGVAKNVPRALFFQAIVAGYMNQTESALDLATRYLQLVPDDPDGVRLLARVQLALQRPEQALATLRRLGPEEAGDPRSLDLFGTAFTTLGRLSEAAEAFRTAWALAPDDSQVLRHFGFAELRTGGPGLVRSLDRLGELAPADAMAAESLVALAIRAGELDRAAAALDALRAKTGETEAVGALTGSLRLARQDVTGAEQAFAELVKRFPASASARLNLVRILGLRGAAEEGEELLKPVLATQPANLPVVVAYVQSLVNRQAYVPAIEALEAARKAAPANAGFTAMLSDVFVRLGDPRRAILMIRASRRPSSELPPAILAALARAQAAAGEKEDARATLQAAVREQPDDLGLRRALIDLLLRQDDVAGATTALRDTLRVAPGNYNLMSALVAMQGRAGPDAALTTAAALRADPANMPEAALLTGEALMRARRAPEAVAAFEAEHRRAPSLPLVLRLADALMAAGRDDDAAR